MLGAIATSTGRSWAHATREDERDDAAPPDAAVTELERIETAIRDVHPKLAGASVPDAGPDGGEQGRLARTAIAVSFVTGGVRSGIDVVRTGAKFPEAIRAGRLGMALTQLVLIAPDTRLIDPTAPSMATVASGLRSFNRFDRVTYRGSTLLGASIALIQFSSAIPNLAEALHRQGTDGLATSTSGRSGVLQLTGGGIGLGLVGAALLQTRGSGLGAGERLMRAATAPLMTKPWTVGLGLASGVLVIANQKGYFASLNSGETRPPGTVVRDAARSTPLLNGPQARVAVLGLGTAVSVGALANQAVRGRSLSAMRPTPLLAGAAFTAVLGAQLAGGFSKLDR